MGSLHENITLAYFVFLGDRSSALCGLFKIFGFRSIFVGFSVGQGHTPSIALTF